MRTRALAAVAAAALLLWPACGETNDRTLPGRATEGAEAEATSTPEGDGEKGFVASANAACERAEGRVRGIEVPDSNEAWLGFGRAVERRFLEMTDALASLDPPRKLDDDFREWLRKLEGSRRAFRSLYRTFAFHYPAVEGPNDRISRALDRVFARDTEARQWVQVRLTDLYSCYGSTAMGFARSVTSGPCGGFYFCE